MSANPRMVLSDVTVRGEFVRKGTIVDIAPGSELEAEYGGASNLRSLTPGEVRDGESSDRSAQGNLCPATSCWLQRRHLCERPGAAGLRRVRLG